MAKHFLERLFAPRSIALFGASVRPEAVGGRVFENLVAGGFKGPLYPINPRRTEIAGHKAYPSLAAIGKPVDLAVFATPAETIPGLMRECGEQGVRGAIVLSAGFGEADGAGAHLLKALMQEVRRYGIRLIGPNCLGMLAPHLGINATFSKNQAAPGSLALVSQSGAICAAILDWAAGRRVGFSTIVSLGIQADVDFGQILDYLALDPQTRGILLYVEGVHHPRAFVSGLRVAARFKPVIVVKAGRHEAGSRAAMSHTGSLVGSDDVFDAALRRAGAVRAMSIEQLFAAAELLSSHHRVSGNRLVMVTNAGGPGVMAADRAAELGVEVAALADGTAGRLADVLPAAWSHANPVDILGDATPERYQAALAACLEDPGLDGLLVMLTPQAMTDPLEVAQAVSTSAGESKKPVLTCWMGDQQVRAAREHLSQAGIPTFESPEASVEAFAYLASHHANQRMLLHVPGPLSREIEPDVDGGRLIVEGALAEGRSTLSTHESKAVLAAFGIPVMPGMEARSPNEALVAAQNIGFPVAMKITSPQISHKSDVGGVRLNISSAHDVRSVYREMVKQAQEAEPEADVRGVLVEKMYRRPHGRELLVGVIRDVVFGPVVTFGAGGTEVEILRDRAVALPPLNSFLARDMIRRTKVSKLLGAFRNMPSAQLDAVVDVLLRVSGMVCEIPHIQELDINPLMADESGVVALDARMIVAYPPPHQGRYDHVAIHPYPRHLETAFQLADGTDIVIRPIRPEDAEIEQAFIRNLSPESRYFRFMRSLAELTPEMLVRFTQIDYDRELALIGTMRRDGHEVEIAVGRYVTNPDGRTSEFALVVADEWRHRGIGSRIIQGLIAHARTKGLMEMTGEVLTTNEPMLHMMRRLGFSIYPSPEDPGIRICTIDL